MLKRLPGRRLLAAAAALLIAMTALGSALAAQPAQQSLLGDRHKALGVACEGCHAQSAPTGPAPANACVGCHGDIDKVAQQTQALQPNPHESHEGDIPCGECHHAHRASEDYCAKCHQFGFKVP